MKNTANSAADAINNEFSSVPGSSCSSSFSTAVDEATGIILLNTFYIKKRKYSLLMHNNVITCQKIAEKPQQQKNSSTTATCNGQLSAATTAEITEGKKLRKTEQWKIPVGDIISVNLIERKNSHRRKQKNFDNGMTKSTPKMSTRTATIKSEEQQQNNKHIIMKICYAYRLSGGFGEIRFSAKNSNIWRTKFLELYNSDAAIIRAWSEVLHRIMKNGNRPRKILMFVNPYGGRRNGREIFEQQAKPLLQLACIDICCVLSQRRDQIRDMIMAADAGSLEQQYDALACVGGDGTFAELFNGLLLREIRDRGGGGQDKSAQLIPSPSLPIGVIPAGSTNTVAYCVHGTDDIKTAVIHMILGQVRSIDLSSVTNARTTTMSPHPDNWIRFFASIMSYGYLGDVAVESERYRWIGPKRYDYCGLKKLISNRGYEGEVIYEAEDAIIDTVQDDSGDTFIVNEKNGKCHENCQRCWPVNERDEVQKTPETTKKQWRTLRGKYFMINSVNLSCACERTPNGFSPYCHLADGYFHLILIRHTPTFFNNLRLLYCLSKSNGDITRLPFVETYRTRRFYFRGIVIKEQREKEEQTYYSQTNEGFISEEHNHKQDEKAEKVGEIVERDVRDEIIEDDSITATNIDKCHEIMNQKVQPQSEHQQDRKELIDRATPQSLWNCDGEIIRETDIQIRSHHKLIKVFMRGPTSVAVSFPTFPSITNRTTTSTNAATTTTERDPGTSRSPTLDNNLNRSTSQKIQKQNSSKFSLKNCCCCCAPSSSAAVRLDTHTNA